MARSITGHVSDLSAIDVDAVLAAKAAQRRINYAAALENFTLRINTAKMLPYMFRWKEIIYTHRVIATTVCTSRASC